MCYAPTQVFAYESHLIGHLASPDMLSTIRASLFMFFSFEAVLPNCLSTPGGEPWKPVNVACSQAPLRELQRYITVYPSLGKTIRPLCPPLQINIYFQRISPAARSTQGIQTTAAKEATKFHLLLSSEMWLRSMPECISSLRPIHWPKLYLDFHKGCPSIWGHSRADGGHDVEILSTATAAASLNLITKPLSSPADGERRLFCPLQWPLHSREGKAFAAA